MKKLRLSSASADDSSLKSLLEENAELKQQLKQLKARKKYGLVWEEKTEDVVELCKKQLPLLQEDKTKAIQTDPQNPVNVLIEGDNYHALSVLNYTHKGKVDVIYIDPPYNTGNKDFIYNDRFVDKEDGYRHSKWLSFMSHRLRLAKNLLANSGVVFISIDDNEQANLKLLCDEVFGDKNFVASIPRITKKSGKQHSENIASNHDYVLIYTRNSQHVSFQGIPLSSDKYPYKDEFYNDRGGYKLNQTLDYDSLFWNPAMDFEIEYEGQKFVAGGDIEKWKKRHAGQHKNIDWVWRWSLKRFKFGEENGFVVIKKGKNGNRIYTKTYANAKIVKDGKNYKIEHIARENKLSSLALTDNRFSNDNAKKEIVSVMKSSSFDFPKPTTLIKQLLEIIPNKSATILDFFAGSGTTGHAVMQLNKEDGGNRQFILATNNENGIAENVTYQRIKKVIEGYGNTAGLGGNLKYYRTDFVASEPTDENKKSLVDKSTEMLCIKENCFDVVSEGNHFKIFKNNTGKHLGIIYDDEGIDAFKSATSQLDQQITTYIFSLDDSAKEEEFEDIVELVDLKPIPTAILNIYRRIFQ